MRLSTQDLPPCWIVVSALFVAIVSELVLEEQMKYVVSENYMHAAMFTLSLKSITQYCLYRKYQV